MTIFKYIINPKSIFANDFGCIDFRDLDAKNRFNLPSSNFYKALYKKNMLQDFKYPQMEKFIENKQTTAKIILSIIDKESKNILSFGSGLAITESYLVELNSELDIHCVDFAPESPYLNTKIHYYDSLDQIHKSFDLILISSVLYSFYEKDILKLLINLNDKLSSTGVIILIEQDTLSIAQVIKKYLVVIFISLSIGKYKYTRLWGFLRSPFSYKKIFEKSNLYLIGINYFGLNNNLQPIQLQNKIPRFFGFQYRRKSRSFLMVFKKSS